MVISLSEPGDPIYAKTTAVSGFSYQAIADWATCDLSSDSQVISECGQHQ